MRLLLIRRKYTKGKRGLNLKDIVETLSHACTEEELQEHFPRGWHELEDEIYKELQHIPTRFKVLEHHVKVYDGNHDSRSFPRAKAPELLMAHSILTPELAAAVFNAKYVNAVPLNRLTVEFLRNDVNICASKALDEIHRASTGIPRMVNRVCEKSLMYTFQKQKRLIDDYMVKYVVEHEMLGTTAGQGKRRLDSGRPIQAILMTVNLAVKVLKS